MKNNFTKVITQLSLIVSIMLAVSSIFLKYILLNETTYLNVLSESGIYEQIKVSVYKKMDSVLSSKNINIDIKESIITDEDIKRETDSAINGVLEYLKTGKNNVKAPDSSIYKQRVSDVLDSVINNTIKPTSGGDSNELSINDKFSANNMLLVKDELQITRMNYIEEIPKGEQGAVKVEQLMSRSEAEARVREILDQKGLTVEEAIEKANKKGITEEQALKILAGYGITIDDYQSGENNSVVDDNSNNSSNSQDNSENGKNEMEAASNSERQNTINKSQDNTSAKSQLDNIKNKLVDEASKSIDKEVEKMDFTKVLESSKIQKLAKITSTIYKVFWLIIMMPIIIMAIFIRINTKGLNSSCRYIGIAFLVAGLILAAAAFSVFLLKIYENINISPAYIKDAISNVVENNLKVLLKYGIITVIIGLFMFIPTIKRTLIK